MQWEDEVHQNYDIFAQYILNNMITYILVKAFLHENQKVS